MPPAVVSRPGVDTHDVPESRDAVQRRIGDHHVAIGQICAFCAAQLAAAEGAAAAPNGGYLRADSMQGPVAQRGNDASSPATADYDPAASWFEATAGPGATAGGPRAGR